MKSYEKVTIYFFSGTGNSKNVASWLAQAAEEYNVESQIINIAKIDRHSINPPDPDSLVVFISPIHGFNYPPIMLNFLKRFPKGKNKVVLMNTRAGMLIGKFITPGVTGIAFYLSAFILMLKGYSIKAILPVDMPSNWISLHPGLNHRTVKYLHEKNKARVAVFARKILAGKSLFRALLEIYDILLAPIALGYYFIGRFILAKTFYASADCDNCDTCIKGCPVKAIIKVDNRPFWTFNCESCMKCMSNCPKKAIETGHGYVLGYSLIFSLVIIGLFYKYFDLYFFRIENGLLKMVIESILFVSIFTLWYRLVHWSMRFKLIERLVVFTSLTKYQFWGRRYKALSRMRNHGSINKTET
jgi:Pyruvate/2-oxoacid:ferredoxin oxidoreductase delta subunit/flavodoxin